MKMMKLTIALLALMVIVVGCGGKTIVTDNSPQSSVDDTPAVVLTDAVDDTPAVVPTDAVDDTLIDTAELENFDKEFDSDKLDSLDDDLAEFDDW